MTIAIDWSTSKPIAAKIRLNRRYEMQASEQAELDILRCLLRTRSARNVKKEKEKPVTFPLPLKAKKGERVMHEE